MGLPCTTALASIKAFLFLGSLAFCAMQLPTVTADCPLDLSKSNFTLVASLCSTNVERAKCCRYINAYVAYSIARYANRTSNLGVTSEMENVCLLSISKTLELYGVPRNATAFCGFGTKIPLNYECDGRTTVMQMLQSPSYDNVSRNCRVQLSAESECKKCVTAAILYLHRLIGTAADNITLNSCRDATFAALASQFDDVSAASFAACFFGVPGLSIFPETARSPATPEVSPSPPVADGPSQFMLGVPLHGSHHRYHLTLIPGLGIGVALMSILTLVVLIFLIQRKKKELDEDEDDNIERTSSKVFPPRSLKKFQEGQTFMFHKYSYKETKKGTENFGIVIGQGGFGTVYKAQFSDGLVLAVKRMDKVSEQGEEDFCREIELLARLHHRHLVALRGFCVEKQERFLMYEYMVNGSLKDHLHWKPISSPSRTPLSWSNRIQIAIDVANALEYLHFYCDPPLCHRDIKSSNILLDENLVAKVADFGLAHASKDGSIFFEPVNTDIRGTPGYMDPEYMVTQELTEKSDIYSYGVLLLELVTGRRAIQDGKNLVEWSQPLMASDSRITELVDPALGDSFDFDQLHTAVSIVQWCTQKEGRSRPSIKQVLRLLYESSDPVNSGFLQSVEVEEVDGSEGKGRGSKGIKMQKSDFHMSGDVRGLASSSSTTRSYCSRSFLLETGSPQSPTTPNVFSQ